MKWKRDKGLLINTKMDKSFKVYFDAYFSGKWCKETESHDEYTEKIIRIRIHATWMSNILEL